MYKCARCKERTTLNVNMLNLECEKCGCKIFYKERPNIKKEILAR